MLIWLLLGCLLLVTAGVVIARMDAATLGPYSTRLLAIAVACAGYYGALSWLRYGRAPGQALRWHFMAYAVPIAAGAGALYCLWRVVQGWRTEVHGLAKTLLTLLLVLALGALAWWCLTHQA